MTLLYKSCQKCNGKCNGKCSGCVPHSRCWPDPTTGGVT